MSYCRFENTAAALKDCVLHLNDPDLSATEKQARKQLIELAREVIEQTDPNVLHEDICEVCGYPQSECECE